MTVFLLAGGGTAGHVNPLLAVADELRRRNPADEIIVLGTREGLEARLVPQRGYELVTIPKVPFPRRPNAQALRFPVEFPKAVGAVRRLLREREVDVVVGFGGFASTPAYVAARGRVPIVIHEANAMPGLANKLGARWAQAIGTTFEGTPMRGAVQVGMPLRAEIATLDRPTVRPAALVEFGLDAERPVLLVTGGSQGAKRVNETIREVGAEVIDAGWQLLHVVGRLSPFDDPGLEHYRVVEYCDRMDLAFAAASLVVARAGASTVSEISAVGLPAIYVPYAVGNGEQAVNIRQVLREGGARTISDGEFTPERFRRDVLPLLRDAEALAAMGRAAESVGIRDAAARVVAMIDGTLTDAAPRTGHHEKDQA